MLDISLAGLLGNIEQYHEYEAVVRRMLGASGGEYVGPLGLPEAARPAVVAALSRTVGTPILWLTASPDEARDVAESLRAWTGRPDEVLLFPAPDALPFERVARDAVTRRQRLRTLSQLYQLSAQVDQRPDGAEPLIIVAPMRGLMFGTLPLGRLRSALWRLEAGDRVPMGELLARVEALGYDLTSEVSEPGQAARRGGIIDIFPPADELPTRIELWGDEIDSLRKFDPRTQTSSQVSDRVLITPAVEVVVPGSDDSALDASLNYLDCMDVANLHPLALSEFRRQREQLAEGRYFVGIEFYAPLFDNRMGMLLDYWPEHGWLVASDWDALEAAARGFQRQAAGVRRDQVDAGELPADWSASPVCNWESVQSRLTEFRRLGLGSLGVRGSMQLSLLGDGNAAASGEVVLSGIGRLFTPVPHYGGKLDDALLDCAGRSQEGCGIVVVSRQAPRIAELLQTLGISASPVTGLEQPPGAGGTALVHGALSQGFRLAAPVKPGERSPYLLGEWPILVVTDGELFGWRMPRRQRAAQRREAEDSRRAFAELSPGDYVVHIEHGVARFGGLTRLQVDGTLREYLLLEYAQGDSLYVPTHQADRVARYVGPDARPPILSRLGTADWERAKARARRAIEDIAQQLLELYARRDLARGTAFAPDTAWQAEMEGAFPYVETEDQLRAIEAVKRDMESDRPMDRLVIGDVGFGKTEVALRAAFKAVMSGKQVAVLAPTTVLVQQHFGTFCERLATFPVNVQMLSRFKSRREQPQILEGLASGEVDIVIGTHRLLSSDVRFRDLGLLIIDEEHRFGVKHKERLKQLRQEVDVLTLTATPIPRTLHMAMTGLRDMSTIESPPEARLPVITHVGPYEERMVQHAIRREIGRGGQVFFVHHRVQGIEMIADRLSRLIPEAQVSVAHGQMDEQSLAASMLNFAAGTTNVLVCTSIVESGLDIAGANTLIVDRADQFGLAQLYQLRGRVGRGPVQAYAYLFYAAQFRPVAEALKRLETMAEARELGAGFRIAMQDLELRGAGDILGARQHGHIAAIGFDLYTRLLAESIKRLRADERSLQLQDPADLRVTLPTVDLPLDAYLPEEYVPESYDRTRLYRRMAVLDDLGELERLESEFRDRFGRLPEVVANLMVILRLRILAHRAGAATIGREGRDITVLWPEAERLPARELRARLGQGARIGKHQAWLSGPSSDSQWLQRLEHLLLAVRGVRTGRRETHPSGEAA